MKPWFHRRWGPMRRGYGVQFVPVNMLGVVWLILVIGGAVGAFWIPTEDAVPVNEGRLEGNVWATVLVFLFGMSVAYIFSEPAPAGEDENENAEDHGSALQGRNPGR